MKKRIARFSISAGLLADFLALPEGTEIEDIVKGMALHRWKDEYVFVISHPNFDEVSEGAEIPFVDILVRRDSDSKVEMSW